jgi:hypothetical protein
MPKQTSTEKGVVHFYFHTAGSLAHALPPFSWHRLPLHRYESLSAMTGVATMSTVITIAYSNISLI